MSLPTKPLASDRGSQIPGQFDVYSQLLKNRIVMLWDTVDDDIAKSITAQLLYLEGENPDQDIWLYINSPGGSVTAGMAIYDTMQFIKPDVSTMCVGQAASMGAFLLAGGTKGKRMALPHSRVMIHQPSGGAQGQASDIEIQANEIIELRAKLNKILALNADKDIEEIARDTERDRFMGADEAREYGLVDKVIQQRVDNKVIDEAK